MASRFQSTSTYNEKKSQFIHICIVISLHQLLAINQIENIQFIFLFEETFIYPSLNLQNYAHLNDLEFGMEIVS